MDSKPAQSRQPEKPEDVQKPVVKKLRNRRFSKEILEDTTKKLVLNVKHTPYKTEKLSDTIRTDHKFDPSQRFYAGNRPL